MRVEIRFHRAPPVGNWVEVLLDRDWKILEYGSEALRAKKSIGQSAVSGRLSTVWYVDLTETDEGVRVAVEVPAFARALYAERRMRETVADFAESVDGRCETEDPLTVDVLSELRE